VEAAYMGRAVVASCLEVRFEQVAERLPDEFPACVRVEGGCCVELEDEGFCVGWVAEGVDRDVLGCDLLAAFGCEVQAGRAQFGKVLARHIDSVVKRRLVDTDVLDGKGNTLLFMPASGIEGTSIKEH
jgi:hypothetical protein